MPSWLVGDPFALYVLLAVAAMILGYAWWSTRRPRYLVGFAGTLAVVAVVWLLNFLVVTDSKQIQANVEDMARSAVKQDWQRVFSHVSNDFSAFGMSKADLQRFAESNVQAFHVREIVVWDFDFAEVSRKDRTAKVAFNFKPKGDWGDERYLLCRAVFVLEKDNHWRLKSFQLFNPAVNTHDPVDIHSLSGM